MKGTLAGLALLVALVACGNTDGDATANVIDREDFVATYVDLRLATLHAPDLALSDQQRADIFSRHHVDEADLMDFADAHGRDVSYMSDVWTDIDARIQKENGAPSADTLATH